MGDAVSRVIDDLTRRRDRPAELRGPLRPWPPGKDPLRDAYEAALEQAIRHAALIEERANAGRMYRR